MKVKGRDIDVRASILPTNHGESMVMRLLDEMTRIVPDGTWVSQLDIKGIEVQVQGQSPAAASLIGLLEDSESFSNPQFRSPVTQIPRSDLERFHLSAEWSGGANQ